MMDQSAEPDFDPGRRSFVASLACAGLTAGAAVARARESFWPDGARLVISISMQLEAGAQGEHADGPVPQIDPRFSDTVISSWYAYGVEEGIPRLLDLWARCKVDTTCH